MGKFWIAAALALTLGCSDEAEKERERDRLREKKRLSDEARTNAPPEAPAPQPGTTPEPWTAPRGTDIEPYDPTDRELAEKLLRGRVHLQRLSEEMRKSGVGSSFEVGDDPRDVWHVGGVCTRAILDDLARRMSSSFSSFGFRRMRCLDLIANL